MFGAICSFNATIVWIVFAVGFGVYIVGVESKSLDVWCVFELWQNSYGNFCFAWELESYNKPVNYSDLCHLKGSRHPGGWLRTLSSVLSGKIALTGLAMLNETIGSSSPLSTSCCTRSQHWFTCFWHCPAPDAAEGTEVPLQLNVQCSSWEEGFLFRSYTITHANKASHKPWGYYVLSTERLNWPAHINNTTTMMRISPARSCWFFFAISFIVTSSAQGEREMVKPSRVAR